MRTDVESKDAVRDNFQKLNAMFKESFDFDQKAFTLPIRYIDGTFPSMIFLYQRVGKEITLQFKDVSTSVKVGATDPEVSLPEPLWPAIEFFKPTMLASNGVVLNGFMEFDTSGRLTFRTIAGWVAATPLSVYGNSVTYLGV